MKPKKCKTCKSKVSEVFNKELDKLKKEQERDIMKIGQRLIMYRSGYTESGKDGHVCIGEIESINSVDNFIGIRQWGYDIKEQDYVLNAYVWGSYTKQQVRKIIAAQPFLKEQFKGIDLKKNSKDFYVTANLIYETKKV